MSTLAALEAALRASPDDPLVLNALTDYFLEHDDPRGEYLRLTLRAKREADAISELAWHDLRAAANRVYAQHHDQWLGPLQPFAGRVRIAHHHYCWPRAVTASDARPDLLAALAAAPLVDRVGFSITDDRPGDDGVLDLLASGLVPRLTHLILSRFGVTDTGAEKLAADPAVRRLLSLRLPNNHISVIGESALAEAGFPDIGDQVLGPPREWDGGADV